MESPEAVDALADIRARTARLVADCASLFGRAGRADLADTLTMIGEDGLKPPTERPVVAIIGETSRGKSALVNALIGRKGLSPVDPQVTTCVPVLFTYADPEWARVWIHSPASDGTKPEPLEVDVNDIDEYAHETKNPNNEKLVQRVEVGVSAPVLRSLGLTVADTPGVGGLDSGHAELTLAQLVTSDAVVLVLDANVEISPSEVKFLRTAAAEIDCVIIAVTKTDLQFASGRIIEVNRERIINEVPELGDPLIVPVSSRLVEIAEDLPAPAHEELRSESGINDLINALSVKVQRRHERLDLAQRVGECLHKLAALDSQIVSAAAASDATNLSQSLAANRNRLIELQQTRITWRNDMLGRLNLIEDNIIGRPGLNGETLVATLGELGDTYRTAAESRQSQEEFDRLALELQADAVRACTATSAAIAQEAADALEAVVSSGVADAADEILDSEDIDLETGDHAPKKRPTSRNWVDHYRTIAPALDIQGLITVAGTAVGLSVLQGWGLLLIPPLAALAIRVHNITTRRTNYLDWLESYLEIVDGVARKTCHINIAAMSSPDLESKVDAMLDAEIAATEATVMRLNSALTGDAGRLAEEAKRAQSLVRELAKRREDAHALLTVLGSEPERIG